MERFEYDNKIVRNFAFATGIWGVVGMLVGLIVALQIFEPMMNGFLAFIGIDAQYTSFGRIRPLHTNSIIFAFVGNGIFMGVYHSLQRLC
mgnify:FL=1